MYKYNTLLNYIHRERLKNPNSTIEEMINEFNNRTYIKKSRYKYNGMTLRKYCEKNNINYLNVLKYINNYKHNDNKPEISDEELINKAIELYTEIFYKGISLKIYCEYKKNLRYTEIRNFILNEKKENPNISEDELVDKYIEIKYKRNGKYMYKGILLTDYCKNNNLNADLIRKSIYRYKLTHADLSEDEIVRRIVENDREGLNQPTPLEPEKKIINNEVKPLTKKKKSTKARILEKLSDLPREDLEFLLLKYQHNYTNLDLASYFNMTLVEVVNKDEGLVKTLREKYKIKVLKK